MSVGWAAMPLIRVLLLRDLFGSCSFGFKYDALAASCEIFVVLVSDKPVI